MRNFLVAIDFSDITYRVIDLSIRIACEQHGSSICLIHVDENLFSSPYIDSSLYSMTATGGLRVKKGKTSMHQMHTVILPQKRYVEHRIISEFAHRMEQKGLTVVTKLITGRPAQEICSTAADFEAHCIIVGAHHHGKLHQLFFREVSSYLINNAPCPVLVTK